VSSSRSSSVHGPTLGERAIGLGRQVGERHALGELLRDRLRGHAIERAIHRDDAAERRQRIARERALVGFDQRRPARRATWLVVLDDDARRVREAPHQRHGGLEVEQVVVRQLLRLAMRLEPRGLARPHVQGRRLMRVLPVAERARALEHARRHGGRLVGRGGAPRQLAGDRSVVARRARERGHCPVPPLGGGDAARQRLAHLLVLRRIVEHDHRVMVLGRGAQQRHAADVDLLHHARVVERAAFLLERVERHRDEIDGLERARAQLGQVGGHAAPGEDGRVHVRVERLHAPAQQLGHAGPVLDRGHREAGSSQVFSRPARCDETRSGSREQRCELGGAALVGEREQSRARPRAARGLRLGTRRGLSGRGLAHRAQAVPESRRMASR
jgi:hypothetical protein